MPSFTVPVRRLRRPALLLASGLALWGCDPVPVGDQLETTGEGGVLTADKQAVRSGETVVLDVSGTRVPNPSDGDGGIAGKAPCPANVQFFTDDAPGVDQTLQDPQTLVVDGVCRLVNAKLPVTLKPGVAGGTRDQEIGMTAAVFTGAEMLKSSAKLQVRVSTPGSGPSSPSSPAPSAPAPAPTSVPGPAPTATPAPTPTPGPAGPIVCNSHTTPPVGTLPDIDFFWNPDPGVVGTPMTFDASQTFDPDGTITRYRWDFDNDGTADADSTSPTVTFTPTATSSGPVCLEVTDSAGNVYATDIGRSVDVAPAGSLTAQEFGIAPNPATAGTEVTFSAVDVPGTTELFFYPDYEDPGAGSEFRSLPGSRDFTHTYPTSGTREVVMTHLKNDGGAFEFSTWTRLLPVNATRRAPRAAAAAAKPVSIDAALSTTRKIVRPGKLAFTGGILSTTGAVVTGRMTGKVTAAARRRIPKPLRFLLSADYAASFSGKQVPLTPEYSGLAGNGLVLARARKSTKTSVCLRVKSDGRSAKGTTWTVVGATGNAAGYKGGGSVTPPTFGTTGKRTAAERTKLRLTRSGKRVGLTACRALVKQLPKLKKRR